jgi:hypothetical protein
MHIIEVLQTSPRTHAHHNSAMNAHGLLWLPQTLFLTGAEIKIVLQAHLKGKQTR